jgi:hypothetical protein
MQASNSLATDGSGRGTTSLSEVPPVPALLVEPPPRPALPPSALDPLEPLAELAALPPELVAWSLVLEAFPPELFVPAAVASPAEPVVPAKFPPEFFSVDPQAIKSSAPNTPAQLIRTTRPIVRTIAHQPRPEN